VEKGRGEDPPTALKKGPSPPLRWENNKKEGADLMSSFPSLTAKKGGGSPLSSERRGREEHLFPET